MKLKRFPVAMALCLGAAASAGSTAAVAESASAPTTQSPAELSDFTCQQAKVPKQRVISVTAVMRPVTGTKHMAMRVGLLRAKNAAGPFHAVKGNSLGTWFKPGTASLGQVPTDVWDVPFSVGGLATHAYYELRVSFRWTGSRARPVTQDVQLLTPLCHQGAPSQSTAQLHSVRQ